MARNTVLDRPLNLNKHYSIHSFQLFLLNKCNSQNLNLIMHVVKNCNTNDGEKNTVDPVSQSKELCHALSRFCCAVKRLIVINHIHLLCIYKYTQRHCIYVFTCVYIHINYIMYKYICVNLTYFSYLYLEYHKSIC